MSLYSKEVMKHFKSPKNVGKMKNPDALGKVGNTRCGDLMYLYIKVGKNKQGKEIIKDISFETFGCTIAIANTSLLTTMVKGKLLETAMKITKDDLIERFKGVPIVKIHCSLLAVDALADAIYNYFLKEKRVISEELKETQERIEKERKEIEHKYSELVEIEEEMHKHE